MNKAFKDTIEIIGENSVAYVLMLLTAPVAGMIGHLTFWSFSSGSGFIFIISGVGLVLHWGYWSMENVYDRRTGPFLSAIILYLGITFGLFIISWGMHWIGSSTAINISRTTFILAMSVTITPLLAELLKTKMRKS